MINTMTQTSPDLAQHREARSRLMAAEGFPMISAHPIPSRSELVLLFALDEEEVMEVVLVAQGSEVLVLPPCITKMGGLDLAERPIAREGGAPARALALNLRAVRGASLAGASVCANAVEIFLRLRFVDRVGAREIEIFVDAEGGFGSAAAISIVG